MKVMVNGNIIETKKDGANMSENVVNNSPKQEIVKQVVDTPEVTSSIADHIDTDDSIFGRIKRAINNNTINIEIAASILSEELRFKFIKAVRTKHEETVFDLESCAYLDHIGFDKIQYIIKSVITKSLINRSTVPGAIIGTSADAENLVFHIIGNIYLTLDYEDIDTSDIDGFIYEIFNSFMI